MAFKRPFHCWDISISSKMMPFCLPQKNKVFMKACDYQRIQPEALCYSLKESSFYNYGLEWLSVQATVHKLWALFYRYAKHYNTRVKFLVYGNDDIQLQIASY